MTMTICADNSALRHTHARPTRPDYFATHEMAGVKVMLASDVVHALVPTYPPTGSSVLRSGFLEGGCGTVFVIVLFCVI